MKKTHDYQPLLAKLKTEIISGTLASTEIIWVVRHKDTHSNEYQPIVNWYHLSMYKYAPFQEMKLTAVKMTVSDLINEIHAFENES